jgi:hypothetical protein
MYARGGGVKPIREILRFVSYQPFAEFHDAHCVRWYPVVAKYEFTDPCIAATDYSLDPKTFLVRMNKSTLLNVISAVDPLAGLRIIKHSILAMDFMLRP